MARNLLDLANDMSKLSKQVNKAANDAAIQVALTIVGELAFKTPVDTSKALSSWFVTLGSPTSLVGRAHYVGESGSTKNMSATETLAQARKVLSNKKAGQVIYITNNQPYIKRLNEGYSQQQAAGFVERAVLIGELKMKDIKVKIGG
ncbi:TPA: hypothetical protein NNT57_004606 [Salmonella enterica]|uniref:Putative tail completion protein n=3 Tax=Lokivirus IMEAB3 TaxID=2560266 RepID=A0A873WM06_9CAUD|nr:tail completion or Neck1 protein [Acinetobacter phage IMEAB3]QBG78742.1 putative tail completion protein [Acinetobacter phage vB_AbaS_D0]QPB10373.1 putative tail completion protein [Acinetobacter phage Ab_SZ3]WUU86639.1 tail completion or Neck1 protein [Acinetobacter phage vB_AbaSi_W9]HCH8285084.1 hypothetical protein [Salmonella enterica]AHI60028.1 putative tail completion protein [Acinetobacter phage IMEAB3]